MSNNNVIIIIPTYDEKHNVGPITEAIHANLPEADILFVDDNSPDGTGEQIDQIRTTHPYVHVMHRKTKEGLGRAYIAGFQWALARDYAYIFEMDADFSHRPVDLPAFLQAIQSADLVLGSRYMDGIRITNWPLKRLLLSKGAATYVRLITGMPFTDPTGGFKCFRRNVLETIPFDKIISSGYSFQVEMTHAVWMRGFRIEEVPITFEDRFTGYSKMSGTIFKEALWIVWKLAFRNHLHRKPPRDQHA